MMAEQSKCLACGKLLRWNVQLVLVCPDGHHQEQDSKPRVGVLAVPETYQAEKKR
jgi:hypothetical protein